MADKLLESLDAESQTSVDRAWLVEAEDRYERYQRGESPAVPLGEALAEARANRL